MDKAYLTIIISASIAFATTLLINWLKVYFDNRTHKSKAYFDKRVTITNELFHYLSDVQNSISVLCHYYLRNQEEEYYIKLKEEYRKAKDFYSKNILYLDKASRTDIDEYFNASHKAILYLKFRTENINPNVEELEIEKRNKGRDILLTTLKNTKLTFSKIEKRFSEVIK